MNGTTSRRNIIKALAAVGALPLAGVAAYAQPKSFLVFFDFGSKDPSTLAKALIDDIGKAIGPNSRVTIIGNTDTAEAQPSKLGLDRAIAVLNQLASRQMSESVRFSVYSNGALVQLVKTGPSTREPQNRRVEITIG